MRSSIFSEDIVEQNGRREAILLFLATVFVFLNAAGLSLVESGRVQWGSMWPGLVWAALMGGAFWLLHRFKPLHDPIIFPLLALLTGWGVILLARLAPNFLTRQIIWLCLGTAVLLITTLLPHNLLWLRHYRYTWLTAGLLLLGASLLLGVNPSGADTATYWLKIPLLRSVFFQPSELLKLLLVVFLASYFAEREGLLRLGGQNGRFGSLPYLAPLLLMWGFCMILLVWQQDLGAATLFFIVFLTLLYMATSDIRYILGGLVLLLAAGVFAYYRFPVVALRVDAWLNPWPDANGRAFQIVQSLYAVAAGGVLGQGVGQGFPDYIPVVHSDFAFAAIAEEWGLVGSITTAACFMLLAHRGLRIALLAKRPFHKYLAAGITILLTTQAFLIMGGVTKLLPLTGVTLPFVSYGGSSLLVSIIMIGLLLFLSSESAP
jgi:cell division protein FtsW (lipid II flippase)